MNDHDEDFQFPDNEESPCEHCELKYDRIDKLVENFLVLNESMNPSLQSLADLFEEFYDDAYESGEKDAYQKMTTFAHDMMNPNYED